MHLSYFKDYRYYLESAALTRWFNRGMKGYIKSLLYIHLDRIGDALLSLPVLENLHRAYPTAYIDVLVNPECSGVYDDIPYIRNRYYYRSLFYCTQGDAGLPEGINGMTYNAVADIRGDRATMKLARSIKPGFRMDDGGLRMKYVFRHKLWRQPRNYHEYDFNLELLRKFGIPLREKVIKPFFDERKADEVVKKYIESHRFVVIHPFAGWPFREWPLGRFKKVIDHLRAQDMDVVVIGTEAAAGKITAATPVRTPHLRDLYHLLKNAVLFIGNDSGPLHLAAAAGTSVIGLYGPNTPEWFGPVVDRKRVHYAGAPCSPCDQQRCKYDRARCMDAISVKEVIRSIDTLMKDPV